MRVRIIRWTDPVSSGACLRVQRWCAGQWEPVRDFALGESEPAADFALKLSMTKRVPVETAVYNDGEKAQGGFEPVFITPGSQRPAMDPSEEVPEQQS